MWLPCGFPFDDPKKGWPQQQTHRLLSCSGYDQRRELLGATLAKSPNRSRLRRTDPLACPGNGGVAHVDRIWLWLKEMYQHGTLVNGAKD